MPGLLLTMSPTAQHALKGWRAAQILMHFELETSRQRAYFGAVTTSVASSGASKAMKSTHGSSLTQRPLWDNEAGP